MRFSDISVIFLRSIQHDHSVDAVTLSNCDHFIEKTEEEPQYATKAGQ